MMKKQTKKLIEENDILCEQLSREANDVLRNMTGYIQRFGISRYEQEKVRRDIAEMLLEGEKGESLSKVRSARTIRRSATACFRRCRECRPEKRA